MNIKKSLWGLLTIMTVAILSVSFVSCSKDDDDDIGDTSTAITDNDPDGTIIANMHHKDNVNLFHMSGNGFDITCSISLNTSNNFVTNGSIASVGKVKGLGYITKVPTKGWTDKIAVVPGTGYVIRGSYMGKSGCARVYVVDYIVDTTGGIIGAMIKYQPVWNPEE
ncbi:MAG: DUF5036 family protein [Bacteroidaceae bacterium]|nr:DUF5036 family protein [Bacteroidaceae bacterium]